MRDLKLDCVTLPEGRFYRLPTTNRWVPSVSTVVNHPTDEKWKKWREDPKNAEKQKYSLERGNRVHKIAEDYLTLGKEPVAFDARMDFQSLKPYLNKIQNVQGVETGLFSDVFLLAGRADCVADYDGVASVIDFKTSTSEKLASNIEHYFHQATAYALMWKELYGEEVPQIVIVMLVGDGTVLEFVENAKTYKKSLFKVIESYWIDKKMSFRKIEELVNGHFEKTLSA